MQLHNVAKNTVNTNVGATSQEFTIRANAKAFSILSSNLYKDKISAPIRELACNALDAQVMAGNPDPIIVHLPNAFEPLFSVEDKGTGMTPKQITDLYTSYFSSSKSDRNDQIGALGLGSKSPFAYTDTFSVESVCEGIRSVYSAVITPSGTPAILLLNREPSSDHNGVKVSFPVKETDFSDFARRAAVLFWAFEKKPTITGNVTQYDKYKVEKEKILLSGDGWKLFDEYPGAYSYLASNSNQSLIRMGNVLYPLSLPAEDEEKLKDFGVYLNSRFLIDMPLGSCDIAPSREELSYDELTIANLKKKLLEISSEIQKIAANSIDKCSSPWIAAKESLAFFRSLHIINYFNGYSRRSQTVTFPFEYKGDSYVYGEDLKSSYTRPYLHIYMGQGRRGRQALIVTQVMDAPVTPITVKFGTHAFIILDDGTKPTNWNAQYARSRLRKYLEQNKIPDESINIFVVTKFTEAERKELKGITIVRYSSLPKPTNAQKTSSKKEGIQAANLFTGLSTLITKTSFPGQKKIYVISNKKSHYSSYQNFLDKKDMHRWSASDLRSNLTYLNIYQNLSDRLLIIPARTFKKFHLDTDRKWIPFDQFLNNLAPIVIRKMKTVFVNVTAHDDIKNKYSNIFHRPSELGKIRQAISPKSPLLPMLSQLEKTMGNMSENEIKTAELFSDFRSLLISCSGKCPKEMTDAVDSDSLKDPVGLFNRYPMLYLLFRDRWSSLEDNRIPTSGNGKIKEDISFLQGAIEYITMVDQVSASR